MVSQEAVDGGVNWRLDDVPDRDTRIRDGAYSKSGQV